MSNPGIIGLLNVHTPYGGVYLEK